jgi:hypothetical protein
MRKEEDRHVFPGTAPRKQKDFVRQRFMADKGRSPEIKGPAKRLKTGER